MILPESLLEIIEKEKILKHTCENCGYNQQNVSPAYVWKGKFRDKPKDHVVTRMSFLLLCPNCKIDFIGHKDEWIRRLRNARQAR